MIPMNINSENFETEVINSDKTVLIDFWATWCGPCRMIAPIVEEIAKEYEGKIKVGKIDVDDQPALANRFAISSIPTILLLRDGKIAAKTLGYQPKDALLRTLGI